MTARWRRILRKITIALLRSFFSDGRRGEVERAFGHGDVRLWHSYTPVLARGNIDCKE